MGTSLNTRIPAFLFALFSSYIVASAQDSTDILIKKIRMEYQKINSQQLRGVSSEPKSESSEGGEVTRYYSKDTLRKIVSIYMGHMGRQTNEYYFSGRQVFFAYIVYYKYDAYMSGKVKEKTENRYYFQNGRLIRWIDEQGKIKDKTLYAAKEKEILSDDDIK